MRLSRAGSSRQDDAGAGIDAILQVIGVVTEKVVDALGVFVRVVVLEGLSDETARYRDGSKKFSICLLASAHWTLEVVDVCASIPFSEPLTNRLRVPSVPRALAHLQHGIRKAVDRLKNCCHR